MKLLMSPFAYRDQKLISFILGQRDSERSCFAAHASLGMVMEAAIYHETLPPIRHAMQKEGLAAISENTP